KNVKTEEMLIDNVPIVVQVNAEDPYKKVARVYWRSVKHLLSGAYNGFFPTGEVQNPCLIRGQCGSTKLLPRAPAPAPHDNPGQLLQSFGEVAGIGMGVVTPLPFARGTKGARAPAGTFVGTKTLASEINVVDVEAINVRWNALALNGGNMGP